MTWYANPAAPSGDTTRCSLTALSSTIADDGFTVVPLASNHHGTRTYNPVTQLIISTPHTVPLYLAAPDTSKLHRRSQLDYREIVHILEVSSS